VKRCVSRFRVSRRHYKPEYLPVGYCLIFQEPELFLSEKYINQAEKYVFRSKKYIFPSLIYIFLAGKHIFPAGEYVNLSLIYVFLSSAHLKRASSRRLILWRCPSNWALMPTPVFPGLDCLALGLEAPLQYEMRPLACGLLSNPTGAARDGRPALAVCREAGLDVRALFSPEHGPRADLEGNVESGRMGDLPVHSLYGATRRPTPEMLEGLDAVLCDLQDVGARFYTYSSTLFHLLEEAMARGIIVVVLDRPNPLGGIQIEGPIIEEELRSFIGLAPLPVKHGMTMGELARYFVRWKNLDESLLRVAKVSGWSRNQTWPDTQLTWRQPSPNLPDYQSAAWYPGLALLEFSGVSVGRGTHAPFQILAAPWLNASRMRHELEAVFQGEDISFQTLEVTPTRATFEGECCAAIRFDCPCGFPARPVEFGMRVMVALRRAHPDFSRASWDKAGQLLGSKRVLQLLWDGDLEAALEISRAEAKSFEAERQGVLLYE